MSACRPRSSLASIFEICSTTLSGSAWLVRTTRSNTTSRPTIRRARSRVVVVAHSIVLTVFPARKTVMRSATAITSSSLCEMKITVRPSATMLRKTTNSASASCGVRTAVGSSRMRIFAPWYRAFKISTRCCSPTESCQIRAFGSTAIPYCVASAEIRSIAALVSIMRFFDCSPRMMFSATVKELTKRKCWCTMPMPRSSASRGLSKCTTSLLSEIVPSSGRYKPVRTLESVDFPAPFSPSKACTSPARASKSTPSLATTPGNRLTMPFMVTVSLESVSSTISGSFFG